MCVWAALGRAYRELAFVFLSLESDEIEIVSFLDYSYACTDWLNSVCRTRRAHASRNDLNDFQSLIFSVRFALLNRLSIRLINCQQ